MVTPIHSVLRAGTGSYSVTVQYPLPCDHNTKLSVTMWLQHGTVSDHVPTTLKGPIGNKDIIMGVVEFGSYSDTEIIRIYPMCRKLG